MMIGDGIVCARECPDGHQSQNEYSPPIPTDISHMGPKLPPLRTQVCIIASDMVQFQKY
jgi:hypothetical protein